MQAVCSHYLSADTIQRIKKKRLFYYCNSSFQQIFQNNDLFQFPNGMNPINVAAIDKYFLKFRLDIDLNLEIYCYT